MFICLFRMRRLWLIILVLLFNFSHQSQLNYLSTNFGFNLYGDDSGSDEEVANAFTTVSLPELSFIRTNSKVGDSIIPFSAAEKLTNNHKIINDKCLLDLCDDALVSITEFLDPKSVLQLRLASKTLNLYFVLTNRNNLKRSLSPQIKTGFECLDNCTASAYYFCNLRTRLSHLLKLGQFETCTDFLDFLNMSLHYYYNNDLIAFWELIEVSLKSHLLDYVKFNRKFPFEINYKVKIACELNLLCFGKALVGYHAIKSEFLADGCIICITKGYITLFKLLATELSQRNPSSISEHAQNILATATQLEKLNFVLLIFDLLPVSPRANSASLYIAISLKNLELTRVLMDRDLDFSVTLSNSALNFMEWAVKYDFIEAIRLLSNNRFGVNYFLCTTALKVAVYYKSHNALFFILQLLSVDNVPIDQIYSKDAIANLFMDCLTQNNTFALIMLLDVFSSTDIEDFKVFYENVNENNETIAYYCNILHFSIRIGNEDGFEVLVTHFETDSLKTISHLGENTYLLATKCGNNYMVNRIAEWCPELAHSNDN